jgi:hypothetical protein
VLSICYGLFPATANGQQTPSQAALTTLLADSFG